MNTENTEKIPDVQDIPDTTVTPDNPVTRRPKKHRAGLVTILLLLILALLGGTAFYLLQRSKPQKAVESFLTSVQKMDFASMESMLQSKDLSALDNADIRNATYTDFFKGINQKMTFDIVKNRFDFQNGTARITAHIKYIDGTEIYKETISEFLRQIVSTALSGSELTEEETQAKLASILSEKAGELQDRFSETEIVYPVIKTGDQWKIVALDEETVKIMSANFKSVEEEITNSLNNMENSENTVDAVPSAEEGDTIDISTDKFAIKYTQHRIAKDFAGKPCLLLYYDYTNKNSTASSAMVDVNIQAYQNGALLDAAIPESNDSAIDHFMAEIKSGETVNVCQVFSLNDTTGDVTLRAGEAFSFGDGATATQILKIQ